MKSVYSLAAHDVKEAVEGKSGKAPVKRRKHQVEELSNSSDLATSDSDEDAESVLKVKAEASNKGKKVTSGRYERVGNSKLVSNEWYAHTALDEAMGVKRSSMTSPLICW